MMVPTTLLLTIITIGFLTPEVLGDVPVLDSSCEHGNCVDGTGEKIVPNEGTYVGQFKKGTFEGQGVFTFKSGPVYDGQWVNGEAHGHAVYNWPNGDKYDGEYRHDQKSGEGTITWPSGRHYTGGWLADKRSGHGIFFGLDLSRYNGTWKDDRPNGHGNYISSDGSVYEGEWLNGARDGDGHYKSPESDYHGDWHANRKHGYGELVSANGVAYKGEWRFDRMQVPPPVAGARPRWCSFLRSCLCLMRSVSLGLSRVLKLLLVQGKGKMRWPNEDHYEGDWDRDEMHGHGSVTSQLGLEVNLRPLRMLTVSHRLVICIV